MTALFKHDQAIAELRRTELQRNNDALWRQLVIMTHRASTAEHALVALVSAVERHADLHALHLMREVIATAKVVTRSE